MRGWRYSCPIDLCLTILSFVVTYFHGVDPHSHRISHAEPSVPAYCGRNCSVEGQDCKPRTTRTKRKQCQHEKWPQPTNHRIHQDLEPTSSSARYISFSWSFSPTLRVVSFMISVHEGTTKLCPVWDCFTFHLFAFAVLFSSFSIALLYIPIASPIRMPFGTPFHVCRQGR